MKNIMSRTITVVIAFAWGTGAYAQDVTYTVPFKAVNMYGGALKPNEIVASETPEGFKFVFGGDPSPDNNQKAIQLYCEVYKLQPGKYNLKFQIKGQDPATSVTVHMTARRKADGNGGQSIQIGEFKRFNLTSDWQEADLPLIVGESLLGGSLILRVGSVPKGGEISIKPDLKITPAKE
jgi:hypothetical protein